MLFYAPIIFFMDLNFEHTLVADDPQVKAVVEDLFRQIQVHPAYNALLDLYFHDRFQNGLFERLVLSGVLEPEMDADMKDRVSDLPPGTKEQALKLMSEYPKSADSRRLKIPQNLKISDLCEANRFFSEYFEKWLGSVRNFWTIKDAIDNAKAEIRRILADRADGANEVNEAAFFAGIRGTSPDNQLLKMRYWDPDILHRTDYMNLGSKIAGKLTLAVLDGKLYAYFDPIGHHVLADCDELKRLSVKLPALDEHAPAKARVLVDIVRKFTDLEEGQKVEMFCEGELSGVTPYRTFDPKLQRDQLNSYFTVDVERIIESTAEVSAIGGIRIDDYEYAKIGEGDCYRRKNKPEKFREDVKKLEVGSRIFVASDPDSRMVSMPNNQIYYYANGPDYRLLPKKLKLEDGLLSKARGEGVDSFDIELVDHDIQQGLSGMRWDVVFE